MNGRNDDEPTTLEDHARQEALTTHFPSLGIDDLSAEQLDVLEAHTQKILKDWKR
ncbi:hypothetical protein [Ralstonia pseudosolanacearum]|uniref:hypothetical protein n=1 Tax=Ralstonia pseudosolanacearum TaxID=1310165 RepID=UPI003AAA667D